MPRGPRLDAPGTLHRLSGVLKGKDDILVKTIPLLEIVNKPWEKVLVVIFKTALIKISDLDIESVPEDVNVPYLQKDTFPNISPVLQRGDRTTLFHGSLAPLEYQVLLELFFSNFEHLFVYVFCENCLHFESG